MINFQIKLFQTDGHLMASTISMTLTVLKKRTVLLEKLILLRSSASRISITLETLAFIKKEAMFGV
jgi:hypothetical protein